MWPLKIIITLIFSTALFAAKKWEFYADKKPNLVTGARWVSIFKVADKGQSATLLFACEGEQKRVQIRQGFGLENGISNALTRSELEHQINKGYQFEKYGFLMSTEGNTSKANVKMRFEGDTKYLDVTVDAYIDSKRPSQQGIVLDSQLHWFLERIREDAVLLIDLPYKTGSQVVTFRFAGFDAAFEKAKQSGCSLR